jgi:hypothetical protein
MTAVVTITRRRHPLEGRSLRVLGRMCRHGSDELLLELPDGSKSLFAAAWTNLGDAAVTADVGVGASGHGGAGATVGSLGDLLDAVALVAALLPRAGEVEEQAARLSPCKEDTRAAHPAQSAPRSGAGATRRAVGAASPTGGRRRDRGAGPSDRQRRDGGDRGER